MEVGNLVEFTYNDGNKALGIVTWEDENTFKAIWSDGNPYKEMNNPLSKETCITGVWEVINFEEEAKMSKKTDELKTSKEDLKIGFDWDHKMIVPTKPYEQLVAYYSDYSSKTIWGVFTGMDGDKVLAHWNGTFYYNPEVHMPLDRITDVVDIIIHEPQEEKPSFKSGDIVVVTSVRDNDSEGHKKALGSELRVTSRQACDEDGHRWYSLQRSDGFIFLFPECNLTLKSDFEKKNLSVAQEAANFGYQAVQGIINAHAEKNRESSEDCDCYSNGNHFKCCGKEEPKIHNCRCGDVPPFNEIPTITQTTLNGAKEKAYAEGATNALRDLFTFSDFDKSVKRTWKDQDFKDAVTNAALGLTGEAGEVADLIKKAIYHGRGFKQEHCLSPSKREKAISYYDIKDELSDVLYYVDAMAQEFGFTLEDVARHNKEKLEKRYEKGFTVEESAQKRDKSHLKVKDDLERKRKEYFTDMGRV